MSAQDLVNLIPKVLKGSWPDDVQEEMDQRIRQDPSLLRQAPYPFHTFLARMAPFSIIETCLQVDPDIWKLPDEKTGNLPIDIAMITARGDDLAKIFQLLISLQPKNFPMELFPDGSTRLHRACARPMPKLEVIQLLYDAYPGALHIRDNTGRLPIHRFHRFSTEILHFLLEKDPALAMEPNHEGRILLQQAFLDANMRNHHTTRGAAAAGSQLPAEMLLDAYPQTAKFVNKSGETALHYAVEAADPPANLISKLIKLYPEAVQMQDSKGQYPLHNSLTKFRIIPKRSSEQNPPLGKLDIINELLDAFPKAVQVPTTEGGYLPIHQALRGDAPLPIVKLLVEKYPEGLRCKYTKVPVLPFHIACARRAPLEVIQLLAMPYMEALKEPDHEGCLPLQLMAGCPAETFSWVLEQYPDAIYHEDSEGNLPIHSIVRYPIVEGIGPIVEKMIEKYPESLLKANKEGLLPLHYAVMMETDKRMDIIKTLLEACPDAASIPDGKGLLPYTLAIMCAASYLIFTPLLEKYPDAIRQADKRGFLPLHRLLSTAPSLAMVKAIVKAYPEAVSVVSKDGRLPLHMACEYRCDLDILQYLFEQNQEAMTTPCSYGRLPIHYACAFRARDGAGFFSAGGFPYPEQNKATPRDRLRMRHVEMSFEGRFGRPPRGKGNVEWVLQQQQPSELASHADKDGWLPLHAACACKLSTAEVKALIAAYPQGVMMQDKDGWTPMHLASAWGNPHEIVKERLNRDPPTIEEYQLPIKFDYNNRRIGNTETVEALFAANPEVLKIADKDGWLPLHSSIASNSSAPTSIKLYKNNYPEAFRMATKDSSAMLPVHILASTNIQLAETRAIVEEHVGGLHAIDGSSRTPVDISRDDKLDTMVKMLEDLMQEYPAESN